VTARRPTNAPGSLGLVPPEAELLLDELDRLRATPPEAPVVRLARWYEAGAAHARGLMFPAQSTGGARRPAIRWEGVRPM